MVMVKVMDCKNIIIEFKLQSHYYVHFQTNNLGKSIEPPYPPRLNSTTTVLLEGWI